MTGAAVAIAFFDPAHSVYGTARSETTLLFEGSAPSALAEGPRFERRGDSLRAEQEGRFSLDLEPLSREADLDGVSTRVCQVAGEVGGARVDCLGTISETRVGPAWEELDALRSISVLLDRRHAVLALSRRPRGAFGHGQEVVAAWLLQRGELLAVEEARISTVYDGEGRQRSAGLELWLPGEDFPRRGSGTAVTGTSLELDGLQAHVAVFRWRMEEREGLGAYELTFRVERPAAA